MIKVAYISNYLNHHTLPVCLEFLKRSDVDFHFIVTMETPKERIKVGYENMNDKFHFVLKAYDVTKASEINEIIKEADIFIVGGIWNKYTKLRYKSSSSKLNLRITERFLKGKCGFFKKHLKKMKYYFLTKKEKNFFLLCCGIYAKQDFSYRVYNDKRLLFGYFPQPFSRDDTVLKNKDPHKMLWVGRLLDWKHPEYVLKIAKELLNSPYTITVIGDGPLRNQFLETIHVEKIRNIEYLGSLNYSQISEYMDEATFFLFTSDSNEGWGAVLNESMYSWCVPIASSLCGSSSALLNKSNSFVFDGTYDDFSDKLFNAINTSKNNLDNLACNAYETISKLWSPKCVVDRIIELYKDRKCVDSFKEGPLSKI